MRIKAITLIAAGLAATLTLGACGSDNATSGSDDRINIITTTDVLGDVIGELAGEAATVTALMGPGDDPHDFSLSAAQAASLREADLVVANGLGLEEGMQSVLDAAASDGVTVIEVGPSVDPIPFGDHTDDEHDHDVEAEDDDDHAHGDLDPHFWFDPIRMATAVDVVAAELESIDPDGDWATRAETLRAELESLDADIARMLAEIPAERRLLVTNHDSLGYFAERYDFEIVGTVVSGGSTMAEPSASDLAALVKVLIESDIRAIFAETTSPDTLAQAVAAELGGDVEVYELYSGSLGEPGSEAETYDAMMRANADIIASALGG